MDVGNDFLDMISKAQVTKSKINRWVYIKLKSFCTRNYQQVKRQPTEEQETIFANCICFGLFLGCQFCSAGLFFVSSVSVFNIFSISSTSRKANDIMCAKSGSPDLFCKQSFIGTQPSHLLTNSVWLLFALQRLS